MSGILRVCWCLSLVLCILVAGCGYSQTESKPREESHLKPLALCYGQYVGQHRGQPPAGEADFKKFVREQQSGLLASFGIKDAESLFVSERDGKPYVVLYGDAAARNPPGPAGQPVVAYEQAGSGGMRFVASSMGAVESVDEARFKQWVPTAAPGP